MSGKAAKIIVCLFAFLLLASALSFARIDAPHNESRGISCGSCHDASGLFTSPFWNSNADVTEFNSLCGSCHSEPSTDDSGGTTDTDLYPGPNVAPWVQTHSSTTTDSVRGPWSVLCVDCHEPHAHDQKMWHKSNGSQLFLVTGRVTGYAAGVTNSNGPVSIISCDTPLSYKSPWTADSIINKTSSERRPLFFPSASYLAASYPVLNIDEMNKTITVQGDVAPLYARGFVQSDFAIEYGQAIKRYINGTFNGTAIFNKTVHFFDKQGEGSFAYDESGTGTDGSPDGICQVCHTETNHWKNTGELAAVGVHQGLNGSNCMDCHPHNEGFKATYMDHAAKIDPVTFCQSCHLGSDVVKDVHGSNCALCHDLPGYLPLGGRLPGDLGVYTLKLDCQDCHMGGHVAAHDFAVLNDPSCERCHLANVVNEHVTRRGIGCGACHDNSVRSVVDTIAAGRAGSTVTCENCHHDPEAFTNGIGKFQDAHHATTYTASGDCTYCHVVGPGTRGAATMSCLLCHGAGEVADPQRTGVEGHANGPALTNINDSRVCFSCHLANGVGYTAGMPLVTPLHAKPTVPGFDFFEKYSFGPDPAYPGKDKINLLFPDMHSDGHSRAVQIGVTDKKHDPVQYNFPAVPYSRVPRRDGADTDWVLAYESGAERGKPDGAGGLTVNIAPAAAITAGGQWRQDGLGWEDSGVTKTGLTPRQHLVEGKLLQGWATPPSLAVDITDGLTASTTLTYETCPADGSLLMTRTSGGGGVVFYWSSTLQQEEFAVSGNTPSWDVDWLLDTGGTPGFIVVSTGPSTARIEKNGESTAGVYDFILQATGSSCPGNSTSLSLTVTVADSAVGSPVVPPYYGLIGDTVVDTLAEGSGAVQPDIVHIAGNLYGVAYASSSTYTATLQFKTFTVDADGMVGDSFNAVNSLATTWGYGEIDTVNLSDSTFALVHYDIHSQISVRTFSTADSGLTFTQVNSAVIDTAALSNQPLRIKHLAGEYYLVNYSGKSYKTVAIDVNGIITNAQVSVVTDIYSGVGDTVEHVAGDVYAALTLKDGKGQVMTFSVVNGIINPTPLDTMDFQGSMENGTFLKGVIRRVSGNIFALAYSTNPSVGNRYYGMLQTVQISDAGIITPGSINGHLVDGLWSRGYDILPITSDVIAVHYGRLNGDYSNRGDKDGVIQTVQIDAAGRITPAPIDYFALSEAEYFDLVHVTGDTYVSANYVFSGINSIRINTEQSRSLVASITSTASSTCDEVSFSVDVEPGIHSGPYLCDFDWGDGTAADTDVVCGSGFSTPHLFAGAASMSDVTWTVRNNDGYLLHPQSKTVSININRDLDGDGLCTTDPCPNDPYNDGDGDGHCGSLNAYILNGDSTVSVIRLFDDTVIKTVPVAAAGSYIAVAANGETAYLSNFTPKNFTDLNTLDDSYSTYSTGTQPRGVALSPNGAYLYMAKYYAHSMAVYRTSDNVKIAETRVRTSVSYPYPYDIAASPDGSRVYMTNWNDNSVSVIRTFDNAEIDFVSVGIRPEAIAVSPDSAFVYVGNSASNSVSIIQTSDNTVTATVNIGTGPEALAVSPDGGYLYVSGANNTVSEINLSNNQVTAIAVGAMPLGVSITPDGSKVYVANKTDNTVSVIKTSDRSVTTIDIATGGESRSPSSIGKFIPSIDPGQASPDLVVTDPVAPEDDLGLDFGDVYEGFGSALKTITITNQGGSDLVMGTLGAGKPLGSEFTLANDTCSGQALPPDAACTFDLSFTPTATGISTISYDSIDIPSNDPDENPTVVTVSGTSSVADITVSEEITTVDDLQIPFGSRVEGTTLSWPVTVSNDGNGGLVLGTIHSTKGGSTPFSVIADTCSNQTLAPAASCTFNIAFNPIAVGVDDDTIEIPSNDPDESLVLVNVNGTGTPDGPDITISAVDSAQAVSDTAIDVGYFDVHASYLDRSLYIRNDGTQPLTITDVSLAADPRSFSLFSNSCIGIIPVAAWPGNSCEIVVRFDPTRVDVDTFNATLEVTSDDPDENLVSVQLNGTGYQSQHAFITNNYTFGGGVCRSDDGCSASYSITPLTVSYTPVGELDNTVHANSSTGFGSAPWGVAATPSKTFFTIPEKGWIRIHNTISKSYVTTRVAGGTSPYGIAASADGNYLYVANYGSATVSVIDQKTYAVLDTIAVDAQPYGIDVSPDGSHVYVTHTTGNSVTAIETAGNTVEDVIAVGTYPMGIIVSPDNSYVYVANFNSHAVSVIRTSDNALIQTIPVGTNPQGVTITQDGSHVYVSTSYSGAVSVIQTSDNSVIATVSGIPRANGISPTADGNYIYVASTVTTVRDPETVSGQIYIIRTADNTVLTSIPTGKGSVAMGRFISAGSYDLDNDGVADVADNCPSTSNSDQADWNSNGLGDACEDSDADTLLDAADNCPGTSNAGQEDGDTDGIGDVCDNCEFNANSDQADNDGDLIGDVCDPNDDTDTILDGADNCQFIANESQTNSDADLYGDVCDNCQSTDNNDQLDTDGDTLGDGCDNCQTTVNLDQANSDTDLYGDVCDNCLLVDNNDQLNSDTDSLGDGCDNCDTVDNDDQVDVDSDLIGDVCDLCLNDPDNDIDGDGICVGAGFAAPNTGENDNCPVDANTNQLDTDGDGIGDVCDPCPDDPDNDSDGDGICVGVGFLAPNSGDNDNCPVISNTDQVDSDCDGAGDACSAPVYYPPASLTLTPQSYVSEMSVSWSDVMNGEDGYRIEKKAESCASSSLPFESVTTIYRHDDFEFGIDEDAWDPGVRVQTASADTAPYSVSDASGSAAVSWENGAVKLQTSVTYHAGSDSGYNVTYLAPKNFTGVLGNADFDIQYDFSYSLTNPDHTAFEKYASIDIYFPATANGNSHMYLSRVKGSYSTGVKIDGSAMDNGGVAASDSFGALRMIRRDNRLAAYAWSGTDWQLLKESSTQLDNSLAPSWIAAGQVANRNEVSGQSVTATVDNFRFNTVGGQPVAALHLEMDEASWTGTSGDVVDSAVDGNDGTSYGGAITVDDVDRGKVGSFDGVDDYVQVAGTGSLENVTDGSFTFTAWAKPASVPAAADTTTYNDLYHTIMSRPGQHTSLVYTTGQKFMFQMYNETDAKFFALSDLTYAIDQWHHLVGVVDDTAKTVSLYVDGQFQGAVPTPYIGNLRDYATQPYNVGVARPYTSFMWFFDGLIDDAQVFNQALDAAEVRSLYNNGMQLKDFGLSAVTDYCYRVYPVKTDGCSNWVNHAAEIGITTVANALPSPPDTPTPVDGATDVASHTPTLSASLFADTDVGDIHEASYWVISAASGVDFDANIIYNSGTADGTNSHIVASQLAFNTVYYWKVMYQDSKGEWSDYSAEYSFTISNIFPDPPGHVSPVDGATDVVLLSPTLTADVFVDGDAGDTHQASQFRISTSTIDFDTNVVYDSGVLGAVTSHNVTASLLSNTTYYWHVRYQDSKGGWSSYSTETSFYITNTPPNTPTSVSPVSVTDVDLQPTLTAGAYGDTDGDTHQASQWRISIGSGAGFEGGLLYDTGSSAAIVTHPVSATLLRGTVYYWQVRYLDGRGVWSAYSTESTFTTTSIISFWNLNEGVGTTAADSYSTNTGTLRNGVLWDTGFAGNGVTFDGIDDDMIWGYADGLPVNNFSLEVMVIPTVDHQIDFEATSGTYGVSGQHYLFGANQSGTDGGAGVSMGTNGISVYEHGASYMPAIAVYDASAAPISGWNHVVITYTNKQPRIYLNGALVHTGLTSLKPNVYAPTHLGGGSYGFFAGTVDEVVLHNTSLSAGEVLSRCQALGRCL